MTGDGAEAAVAELVGGDERVAELVLDDGFGGVPEPVRRRARARTPSAALISRRATHRLSGVPSSTKRRTAVMAVFAASFTAEVAIRVGPCAVPAP